jgi:hypothetical protein
MKDTSELTRRHLRFGWYALAGFSLLGIALESLHAFKQGYYLDVGNETRRLMWRLGHAHGTLLALVNMGFGLSLPHLPPHAAKLGAITAGPSESASLRRISACLLVAALLMPAGFLLGGCFATDADPGPLVALVPAGAVLLIVAAASVARRLRRVSR